MPDIETIYALIDERYPDQVRYVGRTNNPKRRYTEHLRAALRDPDGSPKNTWILDNAEYVDLVVLEEVDVSEKPTSGEETYEQKYKQKAEKEGYPFYNRKGGDSDVFRPIVTMSGSSAKLTKSDLIPKNWHKIPRSKYTPLGVRATYTIDNNKNWKLYATQRDMLWDIAAHGVLKDKEFVIMVEAPDKRELIKRLLEKMNELDCG